MRITAVEAIPLKIGFKRLFQFGLVDRQASANVVLRLTTDEGLVGYGEACPVPAFTGETQRGVVELIEQRVAPRLLGRDPLDRDPLLRSLQPHLHYSPFTLAAVDLALWDLAGKAAGLPVSTLLGGRFRERLPLHGSVGWGEAEAMVDTALEQLAAGYSTLKLYAGRGALADDLRRLAAVRAGVPDHVRFLLDVNGLWSVGDCLAALPVLADNGFVLVEQPLPAADRTGQAEVGRASPIDIAADESVFGPADVLRVAAERTARVVNLGLSKLGGLSRARDCDTVARAGHLKVMVGSVLELGIATAAGLHLAAALPHLAYPSYLVGPLKYERDVVAEPLRVEAGEVAVPTGPGLGVTVDEAALAALDLRRA